MIRRTKSLSGDVCFMFLDAFLHSREHTRCHCEAWGGNVKQLVHITMWSSGKATTRSSN